jgi:Arc/MetJ family transcription regulator
MDETKPAGIIELSLVQELARCQWKRNRIYAIEQEVLTLLLEPESSPPPSPLAAIFLAGSSPESALKRITRYETSASNAYHRALRQLLSIQAQRRREAAKLAAVAAKQDRATSRDILRRVADIAFAVPNRTNPNQPGLSPVEELQSILQQAG